MTECGFTAFCMRKPTQRCALARPRGSSAPRHIGKLVPAEHSSRRRKIADFEQAALQLGKFGLGRLAVARRLTGCRSRLCDASADLGFAGLFHGRGSLLPGAGHLTPPKPNKASRE